MTKRRQDECPNCKARSPKKVVRNGGYSTKAGRKVRLICKSCGYRGTILEPAQFRLPLYLENRFRTPPEKVLRALALYVYGFSLAAVTKLVGIRPETIREHFRVYEKQEIRIRAKTVPKHLRLYEEHRVPEWPRGGAREKTAWEVISGILERRYFIPRHKIEDAQEMLSGLHDELVLPRDHGQHYLKLMRDRTKRLQFARKARAITGLKIEIRPNGTIVRSG